MFFFSLRICKHFVYFCLENLGLKTDNLFKLSQFLSCFNYWWSFYLSFYLDLIWGLGVRVWGFVDVVLCMVPAGYLRIFFVFFLSFPEFFLRLWRHLIRVWYHLIDNCVIQALIKQNLNQTYILWKEAFLLGWNYIHKKLFISIVFFFLLCTPRGKG